MEELIEWHQLTVRREGCIERCFLGYNVGLKLFSIFNSYLNDEYRQSLLHLQKLLSQERPRIY